MSICQGASFTIALSVSGKVYMRQSEEPFLLIEDIAEVKEICSSNQQYAILTKCNKIFIWNEGEEFVFKELDNSYSKDTSFSLLSLGHNFGHVIDQDANLFGWGDNKHGELGTSDNYPRSKLSQIRIFNEDQ